MLDCLFSCMYLFNVPSSSTSFVVQAAASPRSPRPGARRICDGSSCVPSHGCFHMSRTFPIGFLVSLLLATGCSSNSPSAPASSTASVAAPRPVTPTDLAQIAYNAQPLTLVAQNAIVTQPGGTTYTFEVATDAAFANKVQTRPGVAEGGGNQTSLTLATLGPSTTYYWHAQATAGGTKGVFGAAFQLTVGPQITISAPTPVAPANGANTSTQPTLTVANAARTGPAGVITYRFDISTTATFASVAVTGTVAEGTTTT